MEELPAEWVTSFERRLHQARVPQPWRPRYHKWAKFYLRFCQKFGYPATAPTALGPFLTKLAGHNYSVDDRHHAAAAVRLLLRYDPQDQNLYLQLSAPCPPPASEGIGSPPFPIAATHQSYGPVLPFSQTASWEREYGELKTEIRLRNYSRKTLKIYRFWVSRFQAFVRSRPLTHLSNQEVRGFLSSLAVQRGVSASSQNQAFNALVFLYKAVLSQPLGNVDDATTCQSASISGPNLKFAFCNFQFAIPFAPLVLDHPISQSSLTKN